jgi:hypothetical protein
MKVLNVGGNNKQIAIPSYYDGWQHDLLDIDPDVIPDILCDARLLKDINEYTSTYDSVYCSHNLEHFYRHEVRDVLVGFYKVLNENGFCLIQVPHIMNVMRRVVCYNMELTDILYEVSSGPISAYDIIYGWQKQVKESGHDYFTHKGAFTPKMLGDSLVGAGFPNVYITETDWEIIAIAFKCEPTEETIREIVTRR